MIRIWRWNEVTEWQLTLVFPACLWRRGMWNALFLDMYKHISRTVVLKKPQLFSFLMSSRSDGRALPITITGGTAIVELGLIGSLRRPVPPDWLQAARPDSWKTASWTAAMFVFTCSILSDIIKSSVITYGLQPHLLLNATKTFSAHNMWLQTLYSDSFWCY